MDLGPLVRAAALCNDAQIRDGALVGDPTEGALLGLARKAGVDLQDLAARLPRIDELPFDSATKLMATFHRDEGQVLVLVKGAAEVVLARCTQVLGEAAPAPLDAEARATIVAELERMAGQAMRVLAVAERRVDRAEPGRVTLERLADLIFVGLVGIVDPPRPEARGAVARATAPEPGR